MGVREFAPLRLQLGDALHMSDTELRHEVAQSKVVVIANKDVAVEPYVRLIRRLGTPVLHVLEKFCLSDYREVLAITNVYKDDQPLGVHDGGAYWHTDMSYKSANTVFTSMLSVHVPVLGGQTEFMDCVAGLQAVQQWMNSRECPEFIQALDLDALDVYHVFGNRDVLRNTDAKSQSLNDSEIQHVNGAVLHPLVTVHPLSGAHSLYATAGLQCVSRACRMLLPTGFWIHYWTFWCFTPLVTSTNISPAISSSGTTFRRCTEARSFPKVWAAMTLVFSTA